MTILPYICAYSTDEACLLAYMFTNEHLLPNLEMCLGTEGTSETTDSKRTKKQYLHIRGNFMP